MKTTRGVLGLLGLAALVWGLWMAYPMTKDIYQWFIGPPLLDDAIVLPVVGVLSLGVARLAGTAWRWPLHFGIGATALIVYLAITEAWRPYGFPPKPGLHDRDYVMDTLITLVVLWAVVVIAGLLRARAARRRQDRGTDPDVERQEGALPDKAGA
ncbi:hypothetical protein [Kutzneria sp. 744]|uniref:hypothetical protein n=1 Tax=Kutzneria sp. (strain 744) TaxID=345341 RepID=UPI0003EECF7C|nr:hypothetical protein [Kutzneria sp. 744]EWM14180.1 hypothetical protein KUTG_04484 [Kutzneria sp. 744]